VVVRILHRYLLDRPAEIRRAERHCPRDGRQLVVVDRHDSSGPDETAEVHEIEEHAVEAVVRDAGNPWFPRGPLPYLVA